MWNERTSSNTLKYAVLSLVLICSMEAFPEQNFRIICFYEFSGSLFPFLFSFNSCSNFKFPRHLKARLQLFNSNPFLIVFQPQICYYV